MPRQKTLITIIREIVDTEVRKVFSSLLGMTKEKPAKKAANGRKKRKVATNGRKKRRGPGRPPGSKNKKKKPAAE
jgi:hypothetical protein